jgi:hypothetical protein
MVEASAGTTGWRGGRSADTGSKLVHTAAMCTAAASAKVMPRVQKATAIEYPSSSRVGASRSIVCSTADDSATMKTSAVRKNTPMLTRPRTSWLAPGANTDRLRVMSVTNSATRSLSSDVRIRRRGCLIVGLGSGLVRRCPTVRSTSPKSYTSALWAMEPPCSTALQADRHRREQEKHRPGRPPHIVNVMPVTGTYQRGSGGAVF